jgi:cobalt-zinc-cadmium efflux system protein
MSDHGHSHRHDDARGAHAGHHHAPASFGAAFAIGALLNTGYVAAEVVYGLAANSMALLADAAHNLGDVLGLLLAWGAAWLVRQRPTRRRTYGWGRSSILASLINAVILLISVGAIAVEAIRRLSEPQPLSEITVIWVAALGIVINGGTALLFTRGREHDLNVKGAFLHMAADAAISFGVVLAATLIGFTGWLWLDPATSLAIAAVIIVGSWGLLRDSVNLAMDAVPENIDQHEVEIYLRDLPGVIEIHDLHIWGLSTTETALTVHLVRPDAVLQDAFLQQVSAELRRRFGIGHATFQLERGDGAEQCELAPDHVV